MRSIGITLAIATIGTTGLVGCGSDADSTSGLKVVEPGSDVDGTSQVELVELSTGGLLSVPAESNVLVDPANCDMGLSTDDFYFSPTWGAPGTSTTSCSMSAGQALILLPAALQCADTQDDGGASEECIEENWNLTSASVSVDGDVYDDWEERVVDTEVFPVSLPEGNVFDIPAEDTEMRSRAVIFVVEGLPEGEHDIVLAGDFGDGEFAGQLDLTLTVEG